MSDDLVSNANAINKPCIPQETTITNVKLATAYVPMQHYCGVSEPLKSLGDGTAFPELYSPWSKQ